MLALLLASQLVAAVPAAPPFAGPSPFHASELIRTLPRKAVCKNDLGRVEVSFAQPAALYRHGDRPARGLKNWADYPDGVLCAVEDAK